MKKIFIITPIILLLICFGILFNTDFVLATDPGYEIEVSIPGGPTAGTPVELTDYIKYIYIFGLLLIGIAALGVLVYGGFTYMMSDTVTSKEDAKKYIWAAISGLILGLAAFLILNTINPDLTSLTPGDMPTPKPPTGESIPTDCTTDETVCNDCEYCAETSEDTKKVCKPKSTANCMECKDEAYIQKEDGSKCSKYPKGTCKNGECEGPSGCKDAPMGCMFKDECCSEICIYGQCFEELPPGTPCSRKGMGCVPDRTKCCGTSTCIDMHCK